MVYTLGDMAIYLRDGGRRFIFETYLLTCSMLHQYDGGGGGSRRDTAMKNWSHMFFCFQAPVPRSYDASRPNKCQGGRARRFKIEVETL